MRAGKKPELIWKRGRQKQEPQQLWWRCHMLQTVALKTGKSGQEKMTFSGPHVLSLVVFTEMFFSRCPQDELVWFCVFLEPASSAIRIYCISVKASAVLVPKCCLRHCKHVSVKLLTVFIKRAQESELTWYYLCVICVKVTVMDETYNLWTTDWLSTKIQMKESLTPSIDLWFIKSWW